MRKNDTNNQKCLNCKYYYGSYDSSVVCNYIFITGKRRPCEANGFQNGLTLERKDVNGNYCPENCTWATPKQQANNRRNTIFLEWNGERKSVHQWADEMGVSASTLKNRYYLGWSVEEILSLPVTRRKPRRGNLSA